MRPHGYHVLIGIVGVLAIIVIFSLSAAPTFGCLGGYQGPDWQVGNSPLIIIGTIEKVEAGRIPNAWKYRGWFESGGGPKGTPTIATVRIEKILKGKYADKYIRIGSGPINSCCDEDWFYTLEVGQKKIFILPYFPVKGEVELEWSGSIREVADTAMIEARIARGESFRDTYLVELERDQPKVHASAVQLVQDIHQASKTWPDVDSDDRIGETAKKYKTSLAELEQMLARVEPETIRAALAIDWLDDNSGYWWRRGVWDEAIRRAYESRRDEIVAAQDKYLRKQLIRLGVDRNEAEKYCQFINKTTPNVFLSFPPKVPTTWGHFHHNNSEDSGLLTTDFILRCHSYDRGSMLHVYTGTMDSQVLAKLDPNRIKPLVFVLDHNDDAMLRILARQIINNATGKDYADLEKSTTEHGGSSGAGNTPATKQSKNRWD